ncbi:MAG TPA: hypothetical protein VIJ14_07255, partial [Rhabdochlamydiaceae bacterium]
MPLFGHIINPGYVEPAQDNWVNPDEDFLAAQPAQPAPPAPIPNVQGEAVAEEHVVVEEMIEEEAVVVEEEVVEEPVDDPMNEIPEDLGAPEFDDALDLDFSESDSEPARTEREQAAIDRLRRPAPVGTSSRSRLKRKVARRNLYDSDSDFVPDDQPEVRRRKTTHAAASTPQPPPPVQNERLDQVFVLIEKLQAQVTSQAQRIESLEAEVARLKKHVVLGEIVDSDNSDDDDDDVGGEGDGNGDGGDGEGDKDGNDGDDQGGDQGGNGIGESGAAGDHIAEPQNEQPESSSGRQEGPYAMVLYQHPLSPELWDAHLFDEFDQFLSDIRDEEDVEIEEERLDEE